MVYRTATRRRSSYPQNPSVLVVPVYTAPAPFANPENGRGSAHQQGLAPDWRASCSSTPPAAASSQAGGSGQAWARRKLISAPQLISLAAVHHHEEAAGWSAAVQPQQRGGSSIQCSSAAAGAHAGRQAAAAPQQQPAATRQAVPTVRAEAAEEGGAGAWRSCPYHTPLCLSAAHAWLGFCARLAAVAHHAWCVRWKSDCSSWPEPPSLALSLTSAGCPCLLAPPTRLPVDSAKKLRWYDKGDVASLTRQHLREKHLLLDTVTALKKVTHHLCAGTSGRTSESGRHDRRCGAACCVAATLLFLAHITAGSQQGRCLLQPWPHPSNPSTLTVALSPPQPQPAVTCGARRS